MVKGSILLLLFPIFCVAIDEIIDTFEPVIRRSPENITTTPNDLFGYSLVLHKLTSGGNAANTRIVVSAPYGQAQGAALNRDPFEPTSSVTGVVYTCPIEPGSCDGLRGDGTGPDNRLYDTAGNMFGAGVSDVNVVEEKRGQFLGSTLKSTGDSFLVCAHRRLDFGGGFDRNPFGICYHSDRDLRGFESYDPCFDRRSRSFFGFGQCQAGTSGDIIGGNFFLGAPGTYAWRGAVFRRSSLGRTTFSGNGVGSDSISWQGYEVTTGRINSANLDFIVSVPRFSNYRGRVNIYANNDGELRPVGNPPLAGDQVGAYYGFAMAAVDFSGSGMDDLLISAPMYSPGISSPEFGRVYVYRNNGGALSLFTTLDGTIPFGRFGHAMAKLGDINGDGLEDVAISAPFGDQSGTIYIYVGANDENNVLFQQTPVQTIVGSELNVMGGLSSLRSFGTSLSSGVDVDNNEYNDLAVGAYLSQQVFVLRTRPVARLTVNLMPDTALDDTKLSCVELNRPCFNISVCMVYEGPGLENMLQINYTLSVDAQSVQRGVPSRVMLLDETANPPRGTFNGTLDLEIGMQNCIQSTAIFQDGVTDTTTPFTVQFLPRLAEVREPNPTWDGNSALNPLSIPVLSVLGATTATTPFLIECSNATCVPDLQVQVLEDDIEYQDSDGNAVDQDGVVAGIVTALDIPVRITNAAEDAFGARIAVTFNNVFNFIRAVPAETGNQTTISLTCDTTRTTTSTTSCLISDRFNPNDTTVIVFRFQSNNVQGSEGTFTKLFEATSTFPENPARVGDNTYSLRLTVFAIADVSVQVFFDPGLVILGESNPVITNESSVDDLSSQSQRVEGNFVVDNAGPTTIPNARLTIFWPYDAGDERFYLYPYQIEGATCDNENINPLDLLEPQDTNQIGNEGNQGNEDLTIGKRRRRRRQAMAGTDTTISCLNGNNPSCVMIVCNISGISTTINPVVRITAYPDDRVFFQTRSVWNFTVYATVEIVESYIQEPGSGDANNAASASLEGAPFIRPDDDDDIPAWVIIVPIVIGVLIIIVVVVVLYFLGFFKLKKVDKDQEKLNENEEGAPDGEKPESSAL